MLTAILLSLSAAGPPPLQPAGKWTVDRTDGRCVAARAYGGDATLIIQPDIVGPGVQLTVVQRGGGPARMASSIMTLQPSGQTTDGNVVIVPLPDGRRAARLYLMPEKRGLLADATALELKSSNGWKFAATLSQMTPLLRIVEQCQDELLRAWGVNLAEARATPHAEAAGDPGYWLTNDDYPATAWQEGRGGTTVIVWRIGTNGRVDGCRVVETSGSADLDTAACTAITRRARYKPALNERGEAIATYSTRRVQWIVRR